VKMHEPLDSEGLPVQSLSHTRLSAACYWMCPEKRIQKGCLREEP
jgi:hypothetical protein